MTRPAVRVTQMFPTDAHRFVACLIVGAGESKAVETLTARQIDELIDRLIACKETAKKGKR
jgi:hypothetical protein